MKKSFSLFITLVLTSSLVNAHPGHNILDHSGFHYLFSSDHGLWIVILTGLFTAFLFGRIFFKSLHKHA